MLNLIHNLRQTDRNSYPKSNRGAALILVLFVLLVITVLSVSLISLAKSSHLQSKTVSRSIQAKYLARSGIDIAIEYWRTSTPKPSGTMETVYLMKSDHTYRRSSDLSADQIANNTIGQLDTTITKNVITNTWIIDSTATVQGFVHKESAVSEPYVNGHEPYPPWYDRSTGEILCNTANLTVSNGYKIYPHNEINGTVLIKTNNANGYPNGRPLSLSTNNDNNKIIYPAQALFFQSPTNLNLNATLSNPQGFLVASAESIVFEQELTVGCDNSVSGFLGLDFGFLILHVPAGRGIEGTEVYHNVAAVNQTKVNLNARYGLVFFSNVEGRTDSAGWSFKSDNNLRNKGFYFIQQDGGVPIGSLINTEKAKNYNSFGDYLAALLNGSVTAQFFDNYDDAYKYLAKQGKWSTRTGDAQLIPVDPAKVTRPSPDDLVAFSYR